MRRTSPLVATLGYLLALSAGCADSPDAEPPTSVPPVTRPPILVSGEISAIYADTAAVLWGDPSRFVLYRDSTFAMQVDARTGFFEYRGRYSRADSLIKFWFRIPNTPVPWDATGAVRGDSLHVRYVNEYMIHSDYPDGVYIRFPVTR